MERWQFGYKDGALLFIKLFQEEFSGHPISFIQVCFVDRMFVLILTESKKDLRLDIKKMYVSRKNTYTVIERSSYRAPDCERGAPVRPNSNPTNG